MGLSVATAIVVLVAATDGLGATPLPVGGDTTPDLSVVDKDASSGGVNSGVITGGDGCEAGEGDADFMDSGNGGVGGGDEEGE